MDVLCIFFFCKFSEPANLNVQDFPKRNISLCNRCGMTSKMRPHGLKARTIGVCQHQHRPLSVLLLLLLLSLVLFYFYFFHVGRFSLRTIKVFLSPRGEKVTTVCTPDLTLAVCGRCHRHLPACRCAFIMCYEKLSQSKRSLTRFM